MSDLPRSAFQHVDTTSREPSSARWWGEIAAHGERFLGRPPGGLGEIVQGDPPITLFAHPSSLRRPRMTLRTSGVSERPLAVPKSMDDYRYTELLLYLPSTWELVDDTSPEDTWWPARLLKHLGRFIHEQQTFFEPGASVAVVEPGETYVPGTLVSGALLLSPSLETPEFDRLSICGMPCRFLWVHPITEAEMNLKIERRSNALIALMNERRLSPVIDPDRAWRAADSATGSEASVQPPATSRNSVPRPPQRSTMSSSARSIAASEASTASARSRERTGSEDRKSSASIFRWSSVTPRSRSARSPARSLPRART